MIVPYLIQIVINYHSFRLIQELLKFLRAASFQLTDVRQELHRYYEVGKEIETYTTSEELIEKLDYYLEHNKERNRIARKGCIQTMSYHTYKNRLTKMFKIIFM